MGDKRTKIGNDAQDYLAFMSSTIDIGHDVGKNNTLHE